MTTEESREFDYIVVGSGAGGGPVAANLARGGYSVLLLEAGGDPEEANYDVPVFHAKASEDPRMRWDFFVRHYESDALSERDPKYVPKKRGVLYPRAGTLGGCTAHNAMICVYPHNDDWNYIAELTQDASWRAEPMRALFEKLEDCHYRGPYRFLSHLGINPTRHGFGGGWLQTEKAIPIEALGDADLVETLADSAIEALRDLGHPGRWLTGLLQSQLDPNDWRLVQENAEGLRFTPLATKNHARTGTRDYVKQVAKEHPDKLVVELHALASRVLLDEQRRAYAVEYRKGERLYRAHAEPAPAPGEKRVARARREIILSGGAYNTPQLLMLSGIGPKSELAKHGIEVKVDLPGVGRNLQDRYEVGVVNRMKEDWKVLDGSTYSVGDPQYREWASRRDGVYTTNGAVLAVVRKSAPERPLPDLFLFALLGKFSGYYPGYSEDLLKAHDHLTWAVLKAHTINTAGTVTLRSADPRDPPEINFRYFDEGNDANGDDLESVVDGIELVRKMTARIADLIVEEELPGPNVKTRDELRQFVKDHAWGHHASCTCKIGSEDDRMAVLDGNFRVYGTQGLRVVDASVFPKIPGFFIVSAVYMIAEKASQVILADAARAKPATAGIVRTAAPAADPVESA